MLGFVTLALQILPLLVKAGEDIAPFVQQIIGAINAPAGPTQADWDMLHAEEARLRALLNTPAP